ncbi:MAG TPA: C25 family cysteine peptidase [bacterium]
MKRMPVLFLAVFAALAFAQETGARYLIITHDNFYDAIVPFAEWKHKKGMRTRVAKLSETGSSAVEIRNYIVNAYNNWQIPPEFILFVGAPNFIPFPQISYVYTDNYYTNMDADIYNEILSGRLTVHNTTEAQTVVAKMLKYERTPDVSDSLWSRKACLIANDYQDSDSVTYRLDCQYFAAYMVANGYVLIDTLFAGHGDNAATVINRANSGRDFVVYRGNGTNNWYPPFNVNVDNLANGNKLPIVISGTCNTLGTGSTPAAAERWFLTGTPTTLRGASGYFATSTSDINIAYLRSAVTRGFFDGIFQYRYRTFGQACEQGRIKVYQMYPSSGGLDEYYGFTTVGDPEMNIWTAKPKTIVVSHESAVNAGVPETLQVAVTYVGAPVESAFVCLHFDTLVYLTGYTNASGNIVFYFNVPMPGIMDVTVTGRNLYPYEGEVAITTGDAYLSYTGSVINDSLGNGNGIVNPGETIRLWATVKNFGSAAVQDVTGFLRSADTLVYVTDSIVQFGDFPPGFATAGLNPFVFDVSANTYAHPINFSLFMRSAAGDTWNSGFSISTTGIGSGGGGTGPDTYGYYIYDDTDSSTGHAPVYNWVEIAPPAGGSGTIISEITNMDDDTVTLSLPFSFKYYGINYNTIGACTNGFLELGGATSMSYANDPIPMAGKAKRYAAPYWDDLNPGSMQMGHGDIYRYYDSANHRWIVEFYQVAVQISGHPWETFQIILLDPQYYPTPTGDGEMLFQYQQISYGQSNTTGIEDETESRGVEYVYNSVYDQNAAPITSGRVLLITTKPPVSQYSPWLHMISYAYRDSAGGNNNGIIEPNEVIDIALVIRNDGDTLVSGVTGTLRESSTCVSLIDSTAGFGDLNVGAAGNNAADPYHVQVASNPGDTTVGFTVYFNGNGGAYEAYAYFTLFIHDPTDITEGSAAGGKPFLSVFPNPAKREMTIYLNTSAANAADRNGLKIYDVTGRMVVDLSSRITDYGFRSTVVWSGTDQNGRDVPSGVYFISVDAAGRMEKMLKVVIIK